MKNQLRIVLVIFIVVLTTTFASVSLISCVQPASVNVEIERI